MAHDRRFDAVVIGGGQAGLAVGHFLARQHRDFVILDAQARVGDAWRTRWDGLRLFTPGRLNSLPGMPFPGDPHGFATKDEVADYLEAYAATLELPVRTGVRVTDVWPADDGRGFRLATDDGDYEATRSWSRQAPTTDPGSRTLPATSALASRSCTRASSGAPRSFVTGRSSWSAPATQARRSR